MNGTNVISVSDLRQNVAGALDQVTRIGEPLVIFQRSKPTAVLSDFNYFKALEEALLDITDAAEAERAKKEPRISFDKYVTKRFGNGIK